MRPRQGRLRQRSARHERSRNVERFERHRGRSTRLGWRFVAERGETFQIRSRHNALWYKLQRYDPPSPTALFTAVESFVRANFAEPFEHVARLRAVGGRLVTRRATLTAKL